VRPSRLLIKSQSSTQSIAVWECVQEREVSALARLDIRSIAVCDCVQERELCAQARLVPRSDALELKHSSLQFIGNILCSSFISHPLFFLIYTFNKVPSPKLRKQPWPSVSVFRSVSCVLKPDCCRCITWS